MFIVIADIYSIILIFIIMFIISSFFFLITIMIIIIPWNSAFISKFMTAPANYVHPTLGAFNHMFAVRTTLPLVVLCKKIQLCIYSAQLRSIFLARRLCVPRNPTLNTKQAGAFLTFCCCCCC